MSEVEISHREIYDRLLLVEQKIERIDRNTESVVNAFNAAAGAFKVLEFLGKLAKPVLLVGAVLGAIGIAWQNFRSPP